MNKLNITINGSSCTAKPGQTILQACKDNGVFIPTLCHDERLKPFGSCMLCRVEVKGARGTMLACGAEITEGMVISTETEAVKESRKACLELLASQHYGDCKAPCIEACPSHVDIQGYVGHIANGRFEEALKLIKERNPLPVVCGRICTRPCETECRRNILEGPVGIAYLKRFVADVDIEKDVPYLPDKKPATGKKAAIIGAGPAGLSAGWYLAAAGHEVTIFEKHSRPGGMLRYGIPSYRMPREALDLEVDIIRSLGVEIKYNVEFGKDVTVQSLKEDGYNSILIAVGSQVGQPLGVTGEEGCPGVLRGVDFLGSVTEGAQQDFDWKKIVVVGGGNTAMDCCRTAMRLGAQNVTLVYRRSRAEMPADEMEIEEAELEGVEFSFLTNPVSVRAGGGKTTLTLTKMELGEPDASGRRRPLAIAGSEYELEADFVISAIGQTQDLSFIGPDCRIETQRNRIAADGETGVTGVEGVFAAGDSVTGPQTAIKAIAGGRIAALSMDQYMLGTPIMPEKKHYNHVKAKHYSELDPAELADTPEAEKTKMPMLTKKQRERNFKEVELGFNKDEAINEAARCLSCGCKDVNECKLREYATDYEADQYGMSGDSERHPIDESHPYIVRDKNKCIMCGRCVRICMEVAGRGVLGFVGRGYDTAVEPSFSMPFGEDDSCVKCGGCVSSCPVGALIEKTDLDKPGPFEEKLTDTVCTYCGAGCSIELRTNGNHLIRTTADVEKGINGGNLCEKGRFKNSFIHSESRLKTPMLRKNGKLTACSLGEAMSAVRAGMGTALGNDFALYISGRATNEDAEKLAGIAAARGSENVLSLGTNPAAASFYRTKPERVADYEDIKNADLVVAINCDITESSSVPFAAVSRAVREGTRLISAEDVTDAVKAAASKAKAPVIVFGENEDGTLLKKAAAIGAKILVPAAKANARGIAGYLNLTAPNPDKFKAALIWGEDPIGWEHEVAADFTVVCDIFLTETARQADVVLPMPAFSETYGSFTNIMGNVRQLIPAYPGAGEAVLEGLCDALGQAEAKVFPCDEITPGEAFIPGGADVLEI